MEGVDTSLGGGYGVQGTSENGTGVYGQSALPGKYGIQGVSTSSQGGVGVYGSSQTGGIGVQGSSDTGTGVSAMSTTGTALQVEGVATFSRSGTALVAGTTANPEASVTISGVSLTAGSLIFATPQAYVAIASSGLGVGIAAVVPDVPANSFTIYLTAAVEVSVEISWFIVG